MKESCRQRSPVKGRRSNSVTPSVLTNIYKRKARLALTYLKYFKFHKKYSIKNEKKSFSY